MCRLTFFSWQIDETIWNYLFTRLFVVWISIDFIHRMLQSRYPWNTWFRNGIHQIQCNVRSIEQTELTQNETKTEKCIICSFIISILVSLFTDNSLTKKNKNNNNYSDEREKKTNRIVHKLHWNILFSFHSKYSPHNNNNNNNNSFILVAPSTLVWQCVRAVFAARS